MNYRTWVEVNLDNVKHNVKEIKKLLGANCSFMAVVKANGYGHGAAEVAKAALESGANCLGVALLEEAIPLRKAGLKAPIHLLTGFLPSQLPDIVNYELIPCVFTVDHLRQLKELTQPLKVHIKVDTGMSRLGLQANDLAGFATEAKKNPNLEIEGIFTHFATADEKGSPYAQKQLEIFNGLIGQLKKEGLVIKLNHAANSAATILNKDSHLQMVRIGIALYGLHPSAATKKEIDLKPALSWFASLSYVKKLPAATSISYGATHTLESDSLIGTVPVGYADGYSRLLSNNARVIINDRKVQQAGRICMDQFMVNLGDAKAAVGDKVTLIGNEDGEEISADELAGKLNTINYEIVCAIADRVPRIYIGGGKSSE